MSLSLHMSLPVPPQPEQPPPPFVTTHPQPEEPPPLTLLGAQVPGPVRQLETFPAPPHCAEVTLTATELTAFCPVTRQPDFYTVTITYEPRALCLESKSLKLYLWSYRDERIFCETLAGQIAQDVARALAPFWVEVKLAQAVRGGIAIVATARVDDLSYEGSPTHE